MLTLTYHPSTFFPRRALPYWSVLFSLAATLIGPASQASEQDDRIESSAARSYVFKTYLKEDSIDTQSEGGVVTLTGTVLEASHKAMAETTVESLPGVVRVDNQLKVQTEAPPERSDAWIGMKVRTALLFHRNVSARTTEVSVNEGVVVLSGQASSLAQKELTAEYARDIEGVKSVTNELVVGNEPTTTPDNSAETIDDASITAQVHLALLTHRSTSALKTTVSTRDGIVTLGGLAKNAAEKSLVTKLVTDINGVKSVINNMIVTVTTAATDTDAGRPSRVQGVRVANN